MCLVGLGLICGQPLLACQRKTTAVLVSIKNLYFFLVAGHECELCVFIFLIRSKRIRLREAKTAFYKRSNRKYLLLSKKRKRNDDKSKNQKNTQRADKRQRERTNRTQCNGCTTATALMEQIWRRENTTTTTVKKGQKKRIHLTNLLNKKINLNRH